MKEQDKKRLMEKCENETQEKWETYGDIKAKLTQKWKNERRKETWEVKEQDKKRLTEKCENERKEKWKTYGDIKARLMRKQKNERRKET